ncbi:hypothetical protein ABEF92_005015 [Exophiala dermatitidis]
MCAEGDKTLCMTVPYRFHFMSTLPPSRAHLFILTLAHPYDLFQPIYPCPWNNLLLQPLPPCLLSSIVTTVAWIITLGNNSIHKFYPLVRGRHSQLDRGDELRYDLAGGPWRVRIAYGASGPIAGAQRESFRWEYWDRTTLAWRFLVEATGPSQVEAALWTLHDPQAQLPTQRSSWDRFEHLQGGRVQAAIPLNAVRDRYVAARAGPPAAAAAVAAPVPPPAAAAPPAAPPAQQQQPPPQQPADPTSSAPSGDDNAEDES